MIKTIFFDFDGVILESADIKTEAFAEMFSRYKDKIREIVNYHEQNAGISRYVKFNYIYKNILGLQLTKEKEKELGKQFSEIALNKILKVPFVAGAEEFLKKYRSKYKMFIASGTPNDELLYIVKKRNIESLFDGIYGSPERKEDIVNRVINRLEYNKDEAVYVGDAMSDRIAANNSGVLFIERKKDLSSSGESSCEIIKDLTGLPDCINNIEIRTNKQIKR